MISVDDSRYDDSRSGSSFVSTAKLYEFSLSRIDVNVPGIGANGNDL